MVLPTGEYRQRIINTITTPWADGQPLVTAGDSWSQTIQGGFHSGGNSHPRGNIDIPAGSLQCCEYSPGNEPVAHSKPFDRDTQSIGILCCSIIKLGSYGAGANYTDSDLAVTSSR